MKSILNGLLSMTGATVLSIKSPHPLDDRYRAHRIAAGFGICGETGDNDSLCECLNRNGFDASQTDGGKQHELVVSRHCWNV
jgi:hypothetical protein